MSLTQRLGRIKENVLDLLFPLHCVGCGREGDLICSDCQADLPRIAPPWCPRCGLPISRPQICGTCREAPPVLDGLRAPFRFEGAIREAVHSLKYKNLRVMAAPLARLLAEHLDEEPAPSDLLVPVPLHPKRLRERGYNQSQLLAQSLSQLVALPVATDSLRRGKDTAPQARASSVDERRANVAHAFTCKPGLVGGKRVLVIDDVTTTGATLDACAVALKKAGAASVWALTVAREL